MPFTVERTIARPPVDVWKIITDWTIAEYWLGVNKLRPIQAHHKPRAGMRLAYDVRGTLHEMVVTDWQPGERLGLCSQQAGITVHYDYRFETNEGGTRVILTAGCTAQHWAWKLLAPLLQWAMRWSDRKQLAALDHLVRITTGSGT